jgi:hypothetical protein
MRRILEELDDRRRGSRLTDPREKHPLDDFGFVIGHLRAEFGAMALLVTGGFFRQNLQNLQNWEGRDFYEPMRWEFL